MLCKTKLFLKDLIRQILQALSTPHTWSAMYRLINHQRSRYRVMAVSGVRTPAVLNCIEQRQMITVRRETSNHCLGCLRGEVEEFRARRVGNGVAASGVSSLEQRPNGERKESGLKC